MGALLIGSKIGKHPLLAGGKRISYGKPLDLAEIDPKQVEKYEKEGLIGETLLASAPGVASQGHVEKMQAQNKELANNLVEANGRIKELETEAEDSDTASLKKQVEEKDVEIENLKKQVEEKDVEIKKLANPKGN